MSAAEEQENPTQELSYYQRIKPNLIRYRQSEKGKESIRNYMRGYMKTYYKEHPERISEYHKKYYTENRESILERQKERYQGLVTRPTRRRYHGRP